MRKPKAAKISKGAGLAKIKWDEKKHSRDIGGKFKNQPGSDEFKAEPFGTPKTSGVTSNDVIKLHVKANPKKPGTTAANDFAQYKDNMTVGEFKAAVGPNAQGHLTHDMKKGFITIHDPKTLPPVEKELAFSDYVITSKTAGVQPQDKIKLLATHNPKKPGSKAAEDFAKYKDEMTVAEFHTAVGDKSAGQGHILHDLKKGYISVHNPAELKMLKTGAKSPGQAAAEMKIGDKKLGVVTANPYKEGTKNHDDFETTAKQLGLQTPKALGTANKAAVDAQPGATAAAVEPKKGLLFKDDDIIVSKLGMTKTAKEWKEYSGSTDEQLNDKIKNLGWTVKGGAAKPNTHGLADDDNLETYLGNKYTVAEYKTFYKYTDADALITQKLADGTLKVVPKAPEKVALKIDDLDDNDSIVAMASGVSMPVKNLKETTAQTKQLYEEELAKGTWVLQKGGGDKVVAAAPKKIADLTPDEQQTHDLVLLTQTNPYPQNPGGEPSDKWIKFQAISIGTKHNTMSVAKFNSTKALTPAQKKIVLQQMIDDGHVKLVTPEQKAAIAAQKAQYTQEAQAKAAADAQVKMKAQKEAAAQKHKLHYEQVQPADFYNAPKWSKVPGLKMPNDSNKEAHMESTRVALGLKYNPNHTAAGGTNAAVNSYVGSGYQTINGGLRNKKTGGYDGLGPSTKGHVKVLDNLMEETKGDAIMWRGSGMHGETTNDYLNVNNIPPPSEFTDLGYSSMSHNPRKSLGFAGSSVVTGKTKTTLFRVRVPKGAKAAFIGRRTTEQGGMQDEAEVITARGTRFKYISTTRNVDIGSYDNVDVIEVEIIKDDGSLLY